MKKQAIVSLILILSMLVLLLSSCGEPGIQGTYLDANNHVIVEYTDGTTEDLGEIKAKPSEESKESETSTPADDPFTVARVDLTDDLHIVITYSNGTTEDLGYVGVNVSPKVYKVVFLDIDGNTISEQQVTKGNAATAPDAPVVADKTFVEWDKKFDNVKSDLTISPIYKDAESYTVIFKDADGTELKRETVVAGHAATAPKNPTKTDKVFTKWDVAFNNVQSDLVVTAVYRDKNTYTVTFKDYNGVALGTVSVKEGETAKAPVTPTREGYTFKNWSSELTNIKSNLTVTAKYTMNSGTNIIDVSTSVDGKTLTVVVAVKGTVKFCGMEGSFAVPSGLTYVSATDGDGTVTNYSAGTIYFMFSSSNGQNVTKETTLTTLKFNIGSSAPETVKLTTTISDIYDQKYDTVSYKVIGQSIKLK